MSSGVGFDDTICWKSKSFCASYCRYSFMIKHYLDLTGVHVFIRAYMSGIKQRGSRCQDAGACWWFVFFPGGPLWWQIISAIRTFLPLDPSGTALSCWAHGALQRGWRGRRNRGSQCKIGKEIWMLLKCCLTRENSKCEKWSKHKLHRFLPLNTKPVACFNNSTSQWTHLAALAAFAQWSCE